MMKARKIMAALLAATITVSALPAVTYFAPEPVKAAADINGYFYNQLKDSADANAEAYQNFYKAMEQMLTEGKFEKGEDLDLVTAGYFTSEQVEKYANGEGNVLNIYSAARDAFTGDHPEVFYVDFSALSIRIKKLNGEYHLYLGSGRRDNYWTESFKTADDVQQAINKYNSAFKTAYSALSGKTDADFVESAHDYITKHTSYRLENKFDAGDKDQYLIRTAYGSLINQKAVCEGYARLFKAFMDEKGIPCVLIQGAYRPDAESYELHMWTYVEINGAWYAVDPTIDDPTNSKKGRDEVGIDGYENHEYLLKGDNKMAVKYAPSGIRSESNYEFTYPTLSYDNYGSEVVLNSNGLMIHYEQSELEGEKSGKFTISYKGMGLYEAEKQGYYFMYDSLTDRSGTITSKSFSSKKNEPGYEEKVAQAEIGDYDWTGMVYMGANADMDQGGKGNPADWIIPYFKTDAEAIEAGRQFFYTTDEHLVLELPQVPYVKFAVTRIPMSTYGALGLDDSTYYGTSSDYAAASDAIYNANGFYKAPPYPTEVTPSLQSALLIDDGTRTISAKFDQYLFMDSDYVKGNDNKVSLRMNIQDMYNLDNRSGFDNSRVDNFRLVFEDGSVSEPVNAELQLITKDDEAKATVHDVKAVNNTEKASNLATILEKAGDQSVVGYQFDFTPSIMYADDNIFYEFDVKGLRGKDVSTTVAAKDSSTKKEEVYTVSGKEPIAISFLAAHRCAAHAFQSQGYDWNVFGKPTLMDDLTGTDFSKWDVKGDNSDIVNEGSSLSEALSELTHRMVLVATDANSGQEEQMNDLLENNEGGLGALDKAADFDNAQYYNINLTLCKSQIISTGQAVRVTLGFPAGYGPEDKGKTFKVYHFTKDEKGNITGVNEIPCEITEYGLVVWCDAFSPFAIVPIDVKEAQAALAGDAAKLEEFNASLEHKSVIFKNNTVGGTVTSKNEEPDMPGTIKLEENETAQIQIEAEEGYDIETVIVANKKYEIKSEEKDSKVIELPYVELAEGSNVVDVQFVAESVIEKEADEGETVGPHETASKFKDGFSAVIGHSASLGGNIGLNFFVEFKDGTNLEDAKAVCTLPNGRTVEVNIDDSIYDQDTKAYKIPCQVPAKDIGKTVRLHIVLADGTKSIDYTHSVEKYLNSMVNYTKEKDIVSALTHYGNAANAFFSNGSVVETSEMTDITADTMVDYKATSNGTDNLPEGITYKNTSLILESETTLRHYFIVDEEKVSKEDITKYGLTKNSDGTYYYDFTGINAQDLNEAKVLTIGDFSLTASPLSYAYAVLKNDNRDKNLKNLVKALYLYNKAADEYLA